MSCKFLNSRAVLWVISCLSLSLLATGVLADGLTFSIDFQGTTAGTPGSFGGKIDEGTILTPAMPGPPGPNMPFLAATLPPPGVMIHPISELGLDPAWPHVEVDALSYGKDLGKSMRFSVDEFSSGIGPVVTPSVRSEGRSGNEEASADIFSYNGIVVPTTPGGPIIGNRASVDGDSVFPWGGPGVGLIEPNPASLNVLPDRGDNMDALDFNARVKFNGADGPIYFSLDAEFPDPWEPSPPANSGTASANGFSGADVLLKLPGVDPFVYAPAMMLGLDAASDDLDALAIWDNGDFEFDPHEDKILFSVRRGSSVIGAADSAFGADISSGDVLTVPAIGAGTPQIVVPVSAIGLDFDDELDGLDVLCDYNNDNVVNELDIDILRAGISSGSTSPIHDINDDGSVTDADFAAKIHEVLGTEFGDANLDGFINFIDFVTVSNNFGVVGTGWAQGNFNLDQLTDFVDFALMSNNFGFVASSTIAPATVPEPAVVLMLGLAVAIRLASRRKSSL